MYSNVWLSFKAGAYWAVCGGWWGGNLQNAQYIHDASISLILGEKKSKQNYGNVLIGKTNRGIDLNTLAYPSIYDK